MCRKTASSPCGGHAKRTGTITKGFIDSAIILDPASLNALSDSDQLSDSVHAGSGEFLHCAGSASCNLRAVAEATNVLLSTARCHQPSTEYRSSEVEAATDSKEVAKSGAPVLRLVRSCELSHGERRPKHC
jgi:hypothetical protein